MGLFLQVLGVVFLIVVGLLFAAILVIRYRIRRFLGTFRSMVESQLPANITPPRIHLDRLAAPAWANPDAVEALDEPLPGLGFSEAGMYSVREIDGLLLHAWVNPALGVLAVVYEHPLVSHWVDLVTRHQDGTRITYANTAQGTGVDHQPGHEVVRLPGLDTKALFDRFLRERPSKPTEVVTADQFAAVFEKSYADEMDWRNSRGGPTEAEIRAVAQASGDDVDDTVVAATRLLMQRRALHDLDQTLRERFAEESGIPASEWAELSDRVILVHDGVSPEALSDALSECCDDEEVLEFEAEAGKARASFQAFNSALPAGRQFRKIGQLNQPVETDVYCAPDENG